MMTYLLQASTCWIVFYGIYMLFLQRETFFTINRYYLIGALFFGLIIPFIGGYLPANQASTEIYYAINQISEIEITPQVDNRASIFTWLNLLYFVYILGAVIVCSRFVYGLSKIYSIYKNATKTETNNYTLVESSKYHLPFSFFHFIFISKELPLNEDIERVLKHEELHANQWHSLDIVMIELLQIFFWFNPILIFYKNALRQSHEFLADAYVTKDHNRSSYGQLLLRQSTSGLEIALANHFFHSQIKKRITMMYKEKSKRPAMVKYLAAIPVLIAMLIIFSSSQNTENPHDHDEFKAAVEEANSSLESPMNIDNHLTGNSSQEQGDPIFKVVEEMPRFPGCEDMKGTKKEKDHCARKEMLNFIYQNMTYPAEARNADIQGMCIIEFVVEKNGKISSGQIRRDIGGGCGQEALRVVNSMPVWTPGYQKGKAVRVQYTLPVKFKLEGDQKTDKNISDEQKNFMANVTAFGKNSDKAKKENLVIHEEHGNNNKADSEELFKVVEEMPRFPGCEDMDMSQAEKDKCSKHKMLEFIYTNIKYPKEARSQGIDGIAIIQMIIEKDGSVSSSKIIRDPGAGTGTEAKRVIDLMPKWTPGKQRGKNVRVVYTLPIKYKMEGEAKKELVIEKEVDQIPLFPETTTKDKSLNSLLDFVFKNVTYPKEAKQAGIEGMAVVKFVITEKGTIQKVHLAKSPGWGIDETVLDLMDKMKDLGTLWTPAKLNNKNVNFEYVLPIKFKLEEKQKEEAELRKLDVQVLNIKPNPSNGIFTLAFNIKDKTPADIIFYSMNGQKLKSLQKVNVPFTKSFDLSEYQNQTIFMQIIQNEKIHTEKILIQ